ncbi:MAG: hypothetical protein ACLQIB_45560 [Isosphaeraceae bacterium]
MLRHIERVAAQVHRVLRRPAERPPLAIDDDGDFGGAADPEAAEALWDEAFKHNRRQQERMQRAISSAWMLLSLTRAPVFPLRWPPSITAPVKQWAAWRKR